MWEPTDNLYNQQWGLDAISMEEAWNFGRGSNDVVVGIIESGVENTHSDLSSILISTGEQDLSDGLSHGTHVAGIIGAINDGNGISGVSQSSIAVFSYDLVDTLDVAQREGIRVINASFGYFSRDNKGNLVPAPENVFDIAAIENYDGVLICSAGNEGLTIFGNTDNTPLFPAGYGDPRNYPQINNVISVGSLNNISPNQVAKSDFSSFGENSVNIYAPGSDILSAFPAAICEDDEIIFDDGTRLCEFCFKIKQDINQILEENNLDWSWLVENWDDIFPENTPSQFTNSMHFENGYHYMSGTSMAAPHVSGVAALMLSISPNLTPIQIRDAILNNADTITIQVPSTAGNTTTVINQIVRKLNAFKAVSSVTFVTTSINNGISLNGFINGYTLPQNTTLVLPSSFARQGSQAQQNVTRIRYNAFANQAQLTQIHIPSSVTHIGENAFKNTNNASIYLEGRTNVTNTFNKKWNISNNSVYLNGSRCWHNEGVTRASLDSEYHADLCNKCRTATNISMHTKYIYNCAKHCHDCSYQSVAQHTLGAPYTPIYSPSPYQIKKHYSTCSVCGEQEEMTCIAEYQGPEQDIYCALCGQLMSSPLIILHSIIMPNGKIYVSPVPITFKSFIVLSNEIGYRSLSYDYYVRNKQIILKSKYRQSINSWYLIPKEDNFDELLC